MLEHGRHEESLLQKNSSSTIDDGRFKAVTDNVVFQICSRDEAVALPREQTHPK